MRRITRVGLIRAKRVRVGRIVGFVRGEHIGSKDKVKIEKRGEGEDSGSSGQ